MTVVLYILLAVFVLGVMILLHESGHFLAARAFHVTVHEFSIGMGPVLCSRVSEKSKTKYSLRALPVGGYVSMEGEEEHSDDKNSLEKAAVWKRFVIFVAGAVMNLVLGFIIMFVIVVSSKALPSNIIAAFDKDAVTVKQGLSENDRIIKIGKTRVSTGYDMSYAIMHKGSEPVDVTVLRNGEKLKFENVKFKTSTEKGVKFGEPDFRVYGQKKTFGRVMVHTVARSASTVRMVWDSVIDLISGKYTLEAVSGPVGITEVIGDAAKAGIVNFLYICAVITINLGVMNLLPLPALDGGHLVFLAIEAVRKKPVKKEVETMIHSIGLIILFVFMILISIKDVWSLFKV